jgi:hypothetical protein
MKKNKYSTAIMAITCLVVACSWGQAQVISFNTPGGTYSQNFNANLPSSAGNFTWTQGTVFNGWYARFADESTIQPDIYRRTFGLTTGIRLYQWRADANATNGALGAIPINDTGNVYFGLALQNTTGFDLTSFNLGYTGQQWRITTSGPTTITVSYQFGNLGGNLTGGTWNSIDSLTFTSPHSNADENTNVGGTLAANSQILSPVNISNTWNSGEQLWIRFTVQNITGLSQGLAVDDVTFSAIPEPGTAGLLGAALALGWLLKLKRRRTS